MTPLSGFINYSYLNNVKLFESFGFNYQPTIAYPDRSLEYNSNSPY